MSNTVAAAPPLSPAATLLQHMMQRSSVPRYGPVRGRTPEGLILTFAWPLYPLSQGLSCSPRGVGCFHDLCFLQSDTAAGLDDVCPASSYQFPAWQSGSGDLRGRHQYKSWGAAHSRSIELVTTLSQLKGCTRAAKAGA